MAELSGLPPPQTTPAGRFQQWELPTEASFPSNPGKCISRSLSKVGCSSTEVALISQVALVQGQDARVGEESTALQVRPLITGPPKVLKSGDLARSKEATCATLA
jgi:hypothetical protein